jgi:hypothetical protein
METEHSVGGNIKEVKIVANGHCHGTFLAGVIACASFLTRGILYLFQ